uniref:Ovule protein n=1 Tax=Mesocestoides corti TaxID=53468 RepID=A0A5K3EEW3_MESCO
MLVASGLQPSQMLQIDSIWSFECCRFAKITGTPNHPVKPYATWCMLRGWIRSFSTRPREVHVEGVCMYQIYMSSYIK